MRFTLLLFISFFFGFNLHAQNSLVQQWQQILSNQTGESALKLNDIVDNGNSLVVAGFSSSQTGNYMYIGNYSYSGNLLSDTILITEGNSSVSQLLVSQEGIVYAFGSELLPSGKNRIRLVRLNASANVISNIIYAPNPDLSYFFSDAVLFNNSAAIAGFTINQTNSRNSIITRFDINLNAIWERSFTGDSFNWPSAIAVDTEGNFSLVGSANEGFSFMALHYNSNGDFLWQYPSSFTGSLSSSLNDAVCDANGNIYATGFQEDADELFVSNIVTIKLSETGDFLWQQNYNNLSECFAEHIAITSDNQVYIAGNTSDLIVIISYNSDGVQQFLSSYIPDNFPLVSAIQTDNLNRIYVASSGPDNSAIHHLNTNGEILNSISYSTEILGRAEKLLVSQSQLYLVGSTLESGSGVLASIDIPSFNETMFVSVQGVNRSDFRPGGMHVSSEFLWLASVSESTDSLYFTVTKFNLGGDILWQKSVSHTGILPVFDFLKSDNAGNIVGLYHPSQNLDGGGVRLIKYAPDGDLLFQTLVNTEDLYRTGGLVIDASDNIYIAGVNNTNREMYVQKFSPQGERLWDIVYQSPATSIPVARPINMLLGSNNKLVIAASHRGVNDDNNLHIFQFSLDGDLEWNQDLAEQPGNSVDLADLILLPDGKIFAFGYSTITQNAAGVFDASGNLIWSLSEDNLFSAAPRNAAVDNAGNFYLLFSKNNAVFIKKMSPQGVLIAEQELSLNTSGTFYFPYRAEFVNNQLIILGTHRIQEKDYPLGMIVSPELNLISAFVDSTAQASQREALINASGQVFASYLLIDVLSSNPSNSAKVRRYNVGITGFEPLVSDTELILYPNPAADLIHIVFQDEIDEIELFDISGKKLNP